MLHTIILTENLHDARSSIQKIQDFQMSSDDKLVSFDLKSLFTKVPIIEEALEVIGQKLESFDGPSDTTIVNPHDQETTQNMPHCNLLHVE